MFKNMMQYEWKRFTSLKIVYIFGPIYLAVCLLIALIPAFNQGSLYLPSDYRSIVSAYLVGIFYFGLGFMIPYFIGSVTQELENNSFRLTLLAFPKRSLLLVAKFLFTQIVSLGIYFLGIFSGLFIIMMVGMLKFDNSFSGYITAETFLHIIYYMLFIFSCISAFFAITVITKSAIPAISIFFGWICVLQWIFYAIFFVGLIGSAFAGDQVFQYNFVFFLPFIGLELSVLNYGAFGISFLWYTISVISTLVFVAVLVFVASYVFKSRDA